jgi:DNA-binding transcriptional MocR family regulator
MATITLSLDDNIIDKANEYAQNAGSSINTFVQQIVEESIKKQEDDRWIAGLKKHIKEAHGDSKGRKWTREDLYDRHRLL